MNKSRTIDVVLLLCYTVSMNSKCFVRTSPDSAELSAISQIFELFGGTSEEFDALYEDAGFGMTQLPTLGLSDGTVIPGKPL